MEEESKGIYQRVKCIGGTKYVSIPAKLAKKKDINVDDTVRITIEKVK